VKKSEENDMKNTIVFMTANNAYKVTDDQRFRVQNAEFL
jgi:hypothetical protein